ncbi:hypothetical protein HKX17_18015 [Sulfitobacter sp. KE34]|uniref:hypothetical protein n=1 Tax=unclassified Sulfitobacter TaxID=196795 RepID=UPI0023E2A531|nr:MULTISPECIES: hypothetical protein [unclassified Sulfitobacter]MDF3352013.1 hypothetical protein [Sulfitobacter sp. KE12]MDF3355684.1 hypothetical protein [Sulfitobacter sp. KE27]MDF3359358.1 hypothetical protein [Sulfitobacter sp. KE33]MDF3366782.1 hypothetical protein [Sulfitobacter sp. Ks34]MDF3370365.1 hypothetical protein [Sulfitobacter sp. Ks43]
MKASSKPSSEQKSDSFSKVLTMLGSSGGFSIEPFFDRTSKFSNRYFGCRSRFPISDFAGRGETGNGKKNIYHRRACLKV